MPDLEKDLVLMEARTLSYRALPEGRPFEARALAMRSLKTLGVLCMVFGFGGAGLLVFLFAPHGQLFLGPAIWIPIGLMAAVGVLGVAYWICERRIRRGSPAAAMTALILAAVHEGVVLLAGFPGLILLLNGEFLAAFVFLSIALIFTVGLVDLMLHLFEFIRWRRRL